MEVVAGVPKEVTAIAEVGAIKTAFQAQLPLLFAIVLAIAILLLVILVVYCASNARTRRSNKKWQEYHLGPGQKVLGRVCSST